MKRLRDIPELNGLRFIAVLLVIIYHWLPGNIINKSPNGQIGVTFFFVLSGYLISSNLLFAKSAGDAQQLSVGKALRHFYIRRSLRIFPLYYLTLFLVFLLNKDIFSGNLSWYVFYASNFLIFKEQHWQQLLSHFWSLAVEEQFYLVWPFIIFFVKWKWLKFVLPAVILGSLVFISFVSSVPFAAVLPFSCFASFGIGALLAYLPFDSRFAAFFSNKMRNHLVCVAAALLAICFLLLQLPLFFVAMVSVVAFFIILAAQQGFTGITGKIINNTFVQYLGKISYGLYVFHAFIPWLWRCLNHREFRYPIAGLAGFKTAFTTNAWVTLGIHSVILLAVATLSWYCFEKPLNNLKRYFV